MEEQVAVQVPDQEHAVSGWCRAETSGLVLYSSRHNAMQRAKSSLRVFKAYQSHK